MILLMSGEAAQQPDKQMLDKQRLLMPENKREGFMYDSNFWLGFMAQKAEQRRRNLESKNFETDDKGKALNERRITTENIKLLLLNQLNTQLITETSNRLFANRADQESDLTDEEVALLYGELQKIPPQDIVQRLNDQADNMRKATENDDSEEAMQVKELAWVTEELATDLDQISR